MVRRAARPPIIAAVGAFLVAAAARGPHRRRSTATLRAGARPDRARLRAGGRARVPRRRRAPCSPASAPRRSSSTAGGRVVASASAIRCRARRCSARADVARVAGAAHGCADAQRSGRGGAAFRARRAPRPRRGRAAGRGRRAVAATGASARSHRVLVAAAARRPGRAAGHGARRLVAGARALRPVDRMTATRGGDRPRPARRALAVPRTRDEVAHLAATLNAMLDRIERGVEEQHRLVADASHELRTPLAAMRVGDRRQPARRRPAARRARGARERARGGRPDEPHGRRPAHARRPSTRAGSSCCATPLDLADSSRAPSRRWLPLAARRAASRSSVDGRAALAAGGPRPPRPRACAT